MEIFRITNRFYSVIKKKKNVWGWCTLREYNYQNVFCLPQLVIFGGMNDQKDFNDVCILQTRAALKHLPLEMTGMVWFKLAMLLLSY